MRTLRFALAALALHLGGCAVSTEAHRFALGAPRSPTREVALFDGVPTRPYVEAGFVQALAYGATSGDAVVVALRREAAAMGCDAVARVRLDLADGIVHAAGVCVGWVELPPVGPPATNQDP